MSAVPATHKILKPSTLGQAVVGLALAVLAGLAIHNALVHLARHGIGIGFGFLGREASFVVSQSLIDYQPTDSYARVYLVGLLNTLAVSGLGIVAASILGVALGVARLSSNWLLARLAFCYVSLVRNTPLLLQLFALYALLSAAAPSPHQAWQPLPGIFVSNRGVAVPVPLHDASQPWIALALILGVVAAVLLRRRWARAHAAALALVAIGPALLVWLGFGSPLAWDRPVVGTFNFTGGVVLTPEFAALAAGLSLYTAAYIAEIVRAGITGIDPGQVEAAQALGLGRWPILRLVVLPQALRSVVPPLTGQYLNLLKNSSLAIAIGYPDLVAVSDTQINQTGQAIEGVVLMMALYLVVCLGIAWPMNRLNREWGGGSR